MIGDCHPSDFLKVKTLIAEMCLDDNDLRSGQFMTAKQNEKVLGFGRIRNYGGCRELCSLGVTEPNRMKGIGSALVQALMKNERLPLYIVTVIPGFFMRFGFRETEAFPKEIAAKLDYCRSSLSVPEPYVVIVKE